MEVMKNTETKRIVKENTRTRRKNTETRRIRRIEEKTKRKVASQRNQQLQENLGKKVMRVFVLKVSVKIEAVLWMKEKFLHLFQVKMVGDLFKTASPPWKTRNQNFCRSWTEGPELMRRVEQASCLRDLQDWTKGVKRQHQNLLPKILRGHCQKKRWAITKIRESILGKWMLKGLGMKLVEIQPYKTLPHLAKVKLMESPDRRRNILIGGGKTKKNLRKLVKISSETNTKTKTANVLRRKKTERRKKKEKKIKEKVKVESGSKKIEDEKPRDLVNNVHVGVISNKGTDLSKDVKNSFSPDGNIKKRKDMATNGFFLENETRPVKMPRVTPHQSTENGRKLEAHRTPSAPASNQQVVPNSYRLDKGERLINGMIEGQKSSSSKPITSSTKIGDGMIEAQKSLSSKPITSSTMIGDQVTEGSKVPLHNSSHSSKARPEPKMEDPIAEATRRPPHPDSKYLNEVLTVPKLGEWSETDDQDWLFSTQPPSTKMKSESVLVEEHRVWSEAVLIESADVYAMPYVIPY